MRIREIVFLLIWLFLGLFINSSIIGSHGDPLLGKESITPKVNVRVKTESDIEKDVKGGVKELKKGLKEGVKKLKESIGDGEGEISSLKVKLSELDFENGEWSKVGAFDFIPENRLVTKDLEKLSSDSKLKDFRIPRGSDERNLVVEPVDAGGLDEIKITLWNGEIRIEQGSSQSVEFDLVLYSGEVGKSGFEKFARDFEVTTSVEDRSASVVIGDASIAGSDARKFYAVNGTIRVPDIAKLSIAGAYNNVTAENLDCGLDIEVPRGMLKLYGNHSDAEIKIGTGSLEISGNEGDLQTAVKTGDSSLEKVAGHVTYIGGTGRLSAREIEGSLTASVQTGEVTVQSAGGDVNLVCGTGSVFASDIGGDLYLSVNSGTVSMERIEGDAKAFTGTGDVSIGRAGGNIFVKTTTGAVKVKDVSNEILVSVSTGAVSLIGVDSSNLSAAEIKVGTGAIEFALLNGGAHSLNAKTGSGRIRINGRTIEGGLGASQSYSSGTGAAEIMLTTKTGEISVTGLEEARQ